jgi:hypothetical protein
VLFRQVFFHEDTQSAAYVNEIICGRLCDPEDQLSRHVHHLGIALKTQVLRILRQPPGKTALNSHRPMIMLTLTVSTSQQNPHRTNCAT